MPFLPITNVLIAQDPREVYTTSHPLHFNVGKAPQLYPIQYVPAPLKNVVAYPSTPVNRPHRPPAIRSDYAITATRFLVNRFRCHQAATSYSFPYELAPFIDYLVSADVISEPVKSATLVYLQRFHIYSHGRPVENGHLLFVTAFLVALKFIGDHDIHNKTWFNFIPPGLCALRLFNIAERRFCESIDFDLNVCNDTLQSFPARVMRDFGQYRPAAYPSYPPEVVFNPSTGWKTRFAEEYQRRERIAKVDRLQIEGRPSRSAASSRGVDIVFGGPYQPIA